MTTINISHSQITKYFRESIPRVVPFIHQRVGGHVVVPETLDVESDLLDAEAGLEEEVERLAAEVLAGGEQLLGEPGQDLGLSGPGQQRQHQAGRQRGRGLVRVVVPQPNLNKVSLSDLFSSSILLDLRDATSTILSHRKSTEH